MSALAIAISNLSSALDRDAPGAVRLAEKVGPILWTLAGSPRLVPPKDASTLQLRLLDEDS